jgi:H+/Cl- antiporter ClcA
MTDKAAAAPARPDPLAVLRSRTYLGLLVICAILGALVSAVAYFFLKLTAWLQSWLYTSVPDDLGFAKPPTWWPLPVLFLGGLFVAAVIKYLPGHGGESPVDGFKAGGVAPASAIAGIALAALGTLGAGFVLGPEAPLVALGAALAAATVRTVRHGTPAQAIAIIGASGSFAAIATLLGSPIAGAFLLMEASGLAGSMLEVVLVPGLLASGIGALIFVGLDSWTGFGTFSLAVPKLPSAPNPTVGQIGWAIAIGVAAALLGWAIRRSAALLRTVVLPRPLLITPVIGLGVGALAIAYGQSTGKPSSEVLFSGQTDMTTLLDHSAEYSVGALLMLLLCKGVAYSGSLASVRGGPTFPGMMLGAVGGLAISHLPGVPVVTGAAMGIAAMLVAMLRLPLTAVLITSLFLLPDALTVMPVEVVAVVVAYVVVLRLPDPVAPQRDRTIATPSSGPARRAGAASEPTT